jgi:hypothetical protein
VNGENPLLRETRDIWRHLGLPDRGELRAAHPRLPAEETTSLRGLRLIEGQKGPTRLGARWESQKISSEPGYVTVCEVVQLCTITVIP